MFWKPTFGLKVWKLNVQKIRWTKKKDDWRKTVIKCQSNNQIAIFTASSFCLLKTFSFCLILGWWVINLCKQRPEGFECTACDFYGSSVAKKKSSRGEGKKKNQNAGKRRIYLYQIFKVKNSSLVKKSECWAANLQCDEIRRNWI